MGEFDHDGLIASMVGRKIESLYPHEPDRELGEPRLKVDGLKPAGSDDADRPRGPRRRDRRHRGPARLRPHASCCARSSAPTRSRPATSRSTASGCRPASPRRAVQAGLGLLTEDRKQLGLLLELSIRENASLAHLDEISRFWVVDKKRERSLVDQLPRRAQAARGSWEQPVSSLSGGNQQKVLLARWLATKAKVLMFDEPTKGVDVGAKSEIYKVIGDLAAEGLGVVVVSSYLPEVLGLADRVVVMREGSVAGELPAARHHRGRRPAAAPAPARRPTSKRRDMPPEIRAARRPPRRHRRRAARRERDPEERVLTFGDVFGRDAGGLIVLLVLFGAHDAGLGRVPDRATTWPTSPARWRSSGSSPSASCWSSSPPASTSRSAPCSASPAASPPSCSSTASAILARDPRRPRPSAPPSALFNGSLVAYGKLPPFIVTLGMLGIARGVVLVLTDASTVQPLPDVVRQHRQRRLPRPAEPAVDLRRRRGRSRRSCCAGPCSAATSTRSAPTPSPRACPACRSRACSSRSTRSPGLLAAVGGVLFTSRLNAGIPTAGTGYELNAIAACVIGGASLFGAKGGAFGAAAGALIVAHPQQRRQPAGRQRVLPADHHRRPDPRRRRLRPVAGPAPDMSIDPPRGHAPGRIRPRSTSTRCSRPTPTSRPVDGRASPSAPRAIAGPRSDGSFNEGHVARDQRRRSAATGPSRGRRAALPRRRHARAVGAGGRRRSSRCSPPTASTSASTPAAARRRRR